MTHEVLAYSYLFGAITFLFIWWTFLFVALVHDIKLDKLDKSGKWVFYKKYLSHDDIPAWALCLFGTLLIPLGWPLIIVAVIIFGICVLVKKMANFVADELIRRDELKDDK